MTTDIAPDWFVRDVGLWAVALLPYTIVVDDTTMVDTTCPPELSEPYSRLLQHGYACGWL